MPAYSSSRAARRAASVIVDAGRDLKRLPTFSKEHGEIAAAAGDDVVGQIERLDALRQSGALSQEEFDEQKRKLLG